MRKLHLILISMILGAQTLFPQEFLKSGALQLFNDGLYEESIDSMEVWKDAHPSEKGLVYYFLGESHYHQCFDSQTSDQALRRIRQAIDHLTIAGNEPDILTRFSDKLFPIQFKLGWCHFRLAEFGVQTVDNLNQAIRHFENSIGSPESSMSLESRLIAGYCQLKVAQIQKGMINRSVNAGYKETLISSAINHLNEASRQFRQISQAQINNPAIRNSVLFLLQESVYTKAMLFYSVPPELFNRLQDAQKASSPIATAIELLNTMDYESVKSQLTGTSQYIQIIPYYEARWQLTRYILTGDIAYQQLFNEVIQDWQAGLLSAEKTFMQGMRDFYLPSDNQQFIRLIQGNNYFSQSVQSIPESKYWQGWAAFLSNPTLAIQYFNAFLQATNDIADSRVSYLREDAHYRRFMIEFEANIDNRAGLNSLANEIRQFNPEAPSIQTKTERLSQMVQIGLGDAIWNEVLQSRTLDERLDEALSLVQTLMLRATQVFGRERQLYINYLNRLYSITGSRRSQETTFYRGLTLFLQAEIQESAREKRRYYQMAVDTLSNSRGIYLDEAKYVQARSYFASSKHHDDDSDRDRSLEEAKPLFLQLVNNKNSFRSLFYLGEIYRIQGNHRAAVLCYDIVINKTHRNEEGTFWYENAVAAKQNCLAQGDADALNSVRIHDVTFPDNLLEIDGQVISLEKFADRDYIMRNYKQQATQIWLQFGHPLLSVYPSVNPIQTSVYYQYSMSSLNVGVQERLGKITAGVRVRLPREIMELSDITVSLNNEVIVQNEEGLFEKSQLPIYQPIVIYVEVPGYFPFEKEIQLGQPGMQSLLIVPSKQRTVVQSAIDNTPERTIQFNNRLDRAIIGFEQSISIRENTLLYKEFEGQLKYRYIVFSQYHNRFIVTHSAGELAFFNNDPMLTPADPVLLTDNEEIDEINPEGLTVDEQGNIYITDWSNHRICIFSEAGIYKKIIGRPLGRNANQLGEDIFLLYPNRLKIIEPELQSSSELERMVVSQRIVISDQLGIHLLDENGHYWDTLIHNEPGISEWILINVSGSGDDIIVNAFNRADNSFAKFTME